MLNVRQSLPKLGQRLTTSVRSWAQFLPSCQELADIGRMSAVRVMVKRCCIFHRQLMMLCSIKFCVKFRHFWGSPGSRHRKRIACGRTLLVRRASARFAAGLTEAGPRRQTSLGLGSTNDLPTSATFWLRFATIGLDSISLGPSTTECRAVSAISGPMSANLRRTGHIRF